MAMSYDKNDDGKITRKEVPPRMSLEWFRRFDADDDNAINRSELDRLLW